MSYLEERFFTYLIPSPRDKEWGLYVTDAGKTQIPPYTEYPPPGHPKDYSFTIKQGRTIHSYQFVYITKGRGVFDSKETGQISIEEGTLFLLFPGIWHNYFPEREFGWNEYWVGFLGDYADQLCHKGFFRPTHPIISHGFDNSLIEQFHKIIDTIRNEPPGFQQTISAIVLEILAAFTSRKQTYHDESSHVQSVIRKAKVMIGERMFEHIDMPHLAHSLGVSYSWFRWAFKEYTGLSPHKYLLELKIDKAKFLLRNSPKSIKEISYVLGFQSPYYFSRLFKNKTGLSPRQWKNPNKPQEFLIK